MTAEESIANLPKLNNMEDIFGISYEWALSTFPDSMDPHPEYQLMANPTIEQMCNWTSFRIVCSVFFAEAVLCASSGEDATKYYEKFCEEHKQDKNRESNKFSFAAGLLYYAKLTNKNTDGK